MPLITFLHFKWKTTLECEIQVWKSYWILPLQSYQEIQTSHLPMSAGMVISVVAVVVCYGFISPSCWARAQHPPCSASTMSDCNVQAGSWTAVWKDTFYIFTEAGLEPRLCFCISEQCTVQNLWKRQKWTVQRGIGWVTSRSFFPLMESVCKTCLY